MAGPCAEVLLPRAAGEPLRRRIEEWLDAIAERRDERDFWVTDSAPIGGSYRGEGRPFFYRLAGVAPDPEDEWADPNVEELAQVEKSFGFSPVSSVSFCAMCNDERDHRVLAEVCRHVALKLGGAVDFDGLLPLEEDALARLPGTLSWVYLDREKPGGGSAHYADAAFLSAWMRHPAFRMIK